MSCLPCDSVTFTFINDTDIGALPSLMTLALYFCNNVILALVPK